MNHYVQKIFKEVKTDNLLLRMPKQEDLSYILSIEGDPATNQYRPAGPMKDLDEAQESLNRWRNNWLNYGYGYWVVVLPTTSDVIGIGGIGKDRWKGMDVLNLYYRFSPKAWGHGYATELARVAVKMAKDYIPNLSVIARIRPSNKPSIRVAERIGLQHYHKLDSDEHMAFISDKSKVSAKTSI